MRCPERRFQGLPNGRERQCRQAVVQVLQLRHVFGREQVTPHREHLAELEEHNAELLQRFADLQGRRPLPCAPNRADEAVPDQH